MVERLKKAIDKARAHREQVLAGAVPPAVNPEERPRGPVEATAPADPSPWAALEEVTLDVAHLKRRRVVSYQKNDPAHVVFDVLRTRLLKVFKDNSWSRIAITSPTRGCGKTFVAANLALNRCIPDATPSGAEGRSLTQTGSSALLPSTPKRATRCELSTGCQFYPPHPSGA